MSEEIENLTHDQRVKRLAENFKIIIGGITRERKRAKDLEATDPEAAKEARENAQLLIESTATAAVTGHALRQKTK